MKKLITAFTIYSALATAPAAFAADESDSIDAGTLEQRMEQTVAKTVVRIGGMEIRPPFAQLQERMEMQLDDEFVDSLRPFARNLGLRLQRILENASGFDKNEAEGYIVRSLKSLLYNQDVKVNEMLSFEVLERALLIHEKIQDMSDDREVGVIDMRIRILTRAIQMASEKYSDQDMSFFDRNSDIDYGAFGAEYLAYLSNLNKSVFDADIQYYIEKLSLEFYIYDLARSINNESHATEIVEIYDALPGFPNEVSSDRSAVRYIRSLRRLRANVVGSSSGYSAPTQQYYGSLDVKGTIQGVEFRFSADDTNGIYNQCIEFVRDNSLGNSNKKVDKVLAYVNSGEIMFNYNTGWWESYEAVCGQVEGLVNTKKNVTVRPKYTEITGYIKSVQFALSGQTPGEIFEACMERYKSTSFGEGTFSTSVNGSRIDSDEPLSNQTIAIGYCGKIANYAK